MGKTITKDVKVMAVDGKKTIGVRGMDIFGYTKQVREKIEEMNIDTDEYEDGEIVTQIEVEIDE